MRRSADARWRVLTPALVLMGVLVAAVAVTAVLLVFHARTVPEALAPPAAPTALPLTPEETADDRTVDLALTLAPMPSVVSPAGGVVTASACSPGAAIASGTSPWAINGSGLLALATAVPLWRDLAAGDRGADVAALRQELARLGQAVDPDGAFDWSVATAYQAVAKAAGAAAPNSALARAGVVWLSAPEVIAADCPAVLGAAVEPGLPLAATRGQLTGARVGQTLTGLLPGPRVIVVDDVTVSVDEAGQVTDPAHLQALAATATVAARLAAADGTVAATYRLAEPVTVYPVPPAAVAATGRGAGCVLDDSGAARRVEIVGSGLGRTYIRFPDGAAPAAVAAAPPAESTCP